MVSWTPNPGSELNVSWPCATLDQTKGKLTNRRYTIGLAVRAKWTRSAQRKSGGSVNPFTSRVEHIHSVEDVTKLIKRMLKNKKAYLKCCPGTAYQEVERPGKDQKGMQSPRVATRATSRERSGRIARRCGSIRGTSMLTAPWATCSTARATSREQSKE